jgi:hypothetical protein
MQNITLNYQESNSDKVYQVAITESSTGYAVNYSFGRRGSTLASRKDGNVLTRQGDAGGTILSLKHGEPRVGDLIGVGGSNNV